MKSHSSAGLTEIFVDLDDLDLSAFDGPGDVVAGGSRSTYTSCTLPPPTGNTSRGGGGGGSGY